MTLHIQELGSGPPLVMLHGLFIGSLATWYFTTAPALAKTHAVVLYDLRGHGKSERVRAGYDVATMAQDLASVVGSLSGDPVALVGHSYGAVVALRFALDNPGKVRKLALVEAPLPPSRLEELDAFMARTPEAMVAALPEALRQVAMEAAPSPPLSSPPSPRAVRGALRHGRRSRRLLESLRFLATESSLLQDLRAEKDIEDADLATVACPVLCLYGETSSCLPTGRRLASAIPGAELEVLPGGHFLPLEGPAELTARLVRFFDG